MKKLILAAFALTTAVGVFAQGTVVFQGYGDLAQRTSHVYGPSTTAPTLSLTGNTATDNPAGTTSYTAAGMSLIGSSGLSGQYGASTTFAQLLYANGTVSDPTSLQPGGQTTTFRTGATVGRITQITDVINGLTPDSATATFAMVAWDNSSGQYGDWTKASVAWMAGLIAAGESPLFTVQSIGGNVNTPPSVIAPTFNIFMQVPEPSTFALAGLGAAALMIFRRRK